MIIARIHGGLGNQMFQYALGRNLSLRLGTELKLDVSWFDPSIAFEYGLGVFEIDPVFASKEETQALKEHRPGRLECLKCCLFGVNPKPPASIIWEKQFHFDPSILDLSDNVYLDGYWQSEQYFSGIEERIRKEFKMRVPQTEENHAISEAIAETNSVSLHVRRGDYVHNSKTNATHGVCSLDYYRRCISELTERIENPHFFLFSDDPAWVKDNLKLVYATTLVDHNGPGKSYEDLRLMAQCRHHILANSSFSWWGAWLNPRLDKLVYAPLQWFRRPEQDTSTLMPAGWRRL